MHRVTIVGGGNGAHAAAADLAILGHEVSLFEAAEFGLGIAVTMRQGGIWAEGVVEGFAKLKAVSTDASEVIPDAEYVIICAPGFALEPLGRAIAPHLHDGQRLVVNPGAMGSSVRLMRLFRSLGIDAERLGVMCGETASLTYAARIQEPGRVRVTLKTENILFAAFPGRHTAALYPEVRGLFPGVIPARHVFDTGLNNGNPISHPTATLLNAGCIEQGGDDFYLYRDGMTPSVVEVMKLLDRERLALCRIVGATIMPVEERIVLFGYAKPSESLHISYSTSEIYNQAAGPSNLQHRYLTEDIPYGLVPWASLARAFASPAPVMEAEITIAGALLGTDYWQSGITIESMGLGGLGPRDLDGVLMEGFGS